MPLYKSEKKLIKFIDHLSIKDFNWNLMSKREKEFFKDEGQAVILFTLCYSKFIYEVPVKRLIKEFEISEGLCFYLISLLKKEAVTLQSIIDQHLIDLGADLSEDETSLVVRDFINWGFNYALMNYGL